MRVVTITTRTNPSAPGRRRRSLTGPVWEYPHPTPPPPPHTGNSIVGGYVVRDPASPGVFGRYVYGDTYDSRLWSITLEVPDAQGDTEPAKSERARIRSARTPVRACTRFGLGQVYGDPDDSATAA